MLPTLFFSGTISGRATVTTMKEFNLLVNTRKLYMEKINYEKYDENFS